MVTPDIREARADDMRRSAAPDGVLDPPARAARERTLAMLMARDQTAAATLKRALRALNVDAYWTRRGVDGLEAAQRTRFDLLLIDLDLPDMSPAEIVRRIRDSDQHTRVIVLRDAVTRSAEADAIARSGSLRILEKPFTTVDVVHAVNAALKGDAPAADRCGTPALAAPAAGGADLDGPVRRASLGSIAERWASFVLRAIDADCDPKTIANCASSMGVSRSALRECCRLLHVSAHDARDFARLIRAICRSGEQWQPEAVLDLSDARTLRKLVVRAGFTGCTTVTPTMPTFLERQRWIPRDNPGLAALRTLLLGANGHD